MNLLKTGIAKLDQLLDGGIKKNSSVLFCSTPGVENLQFAQQILHNQLKNGGHGLYFVDNKKPSAVRFMLKNYDWDVEPYEKKGVFSFFDCYSGLISQPSKERFFVENPLDLKEIDRKLLVALNKLKNNHSILIFDCLSTLLDENKSQDEVLDYVEKWLNDSRKFEVNPIFLFTEWPYEKKIIKKIEGMFDCVIALKAIEREVILRNYFFVSRVNWTKKIEKHGIPFKILRPGGIRVYIPKVLVTGPYNAGKTSFTHSASTRAVSVDRFGTTVALDHGHVDYKGFAVDLFGTPGQERFDPILELLGGESLGVVVVVDSTSPKGFIRAKDMLEKTKTEGLPSVVVANKSNLPGALKPEEIRKKMNLPKEMPIVPVIAEDLAEVREGKPCKLRQKDTDLVFDKLFEEIV